MQLQFYGFNGKNPVLDFIKSLDIKDRTKILACFKNIEELGFDCPRVQFRQIKKRLWEIKIRSVNGGYRIFYILLKKNLLILLHAYKKQSQKLPKKELAIAERRMIEVLQNEKVYYIG